MDKNSLGHLEDVANLLDNAYATRVLIKEQPSDIEEAFKLISKALEIIGEQVDF